MTTGNSRLVMRFIVVILSLAMTATVLAGPANAAGHPHDGLVVGFGDSVAAGFRADTELSDSPYARQCQRTDEAYPAQVGHQLGLTTVNLACSGATVPAGLNGPQPTDQSVVPAQLRQARDLPRISLATITILANDVRWSYWIEQCINPTIDCATAANTAAFRLMLTKAGARLAVSLSTIVFRLRVRHTALTGYYDPMGPLAGPVFGLMPDEISWYRARLAELNHALAAEARIFPRVAFVPVSLDAAGGDVILQPDGIFHPTAQGQGKLADAVLSDCRKHSPTG